MTDTYTSYIGKDSDAGKDRRQIRGWQRMRCLDSIYHEFGHEFEQTPGDSEEQGRLACYSPWTCKASDTTKHAHTTKHTHTHTHTHTFTFKL